MVNLTLSSVEQAIVNKVEEINEQFKMGAVINSDFCPGSRGISSQILITVMGRLADALNITIPDNCYIFHDKKTQSQLSIREAAKKLIKVATDGK